MYAAAAERYGGIDILYNNAGIMPSDDGSILGTDVETWSRVHVCTCRWGSWRGRAR
jgi:NAD(P)-dependent dehydrogenase (short-subunit alcohol dehydrogenase family)